MVWPVVALPSPASRIRRPKFVLRRPRAIDPGLRHRLASSSPRRRQPEMRTWTPVTALADTGVANVTVVVPPGVTLMAVRIPSAVAPAAAVRVTPMGSPLQAASINETTTAVTSYRRVVVEWSMQLCTRCAHRRWCRTRPQPESQTPESLS